MAKAEGLRTDAMRFRRIAGSASSPSLNSACPACTRLGSHGLHLLQRPLKVCACRPFIGGLVFAHANLPFWWSDGAPRFAMEPNGCPSHWLFDPGRGSPVIAHLSQSHHEASTTTRRHGCLLSNRLGALSYCTLLAKQSPSAHRSCARSMSHRNTIRPQAPIEAKTMAIR